MKATAKAIAAIIAILLVLFCLSGATFAASCVECENAGTGSCQCDDFTGRDPNTTGDAPYIYLKESKTGSSSPVAANPVAAGDGADICWFFDLTNTTNVVDWTFRCSDRDYHLNAFVDKVLDSNGLQPGTPPYHEMQFDEDHEVTNPVAGVRVLIGLFTAFLTSADLPSLVCLPNAADPDCAWTNIFDLQRALGAKFQINSEDATLLSTIRMEASLTPNAGTRVYNRWARFMQSTSVAVANITQVTSPAVERCLIKDVYIEFTDNSNDRVKENLSAGTLKVGARIGSTDYELCTIASGSSSNTCNDLSREIAKGATQALYLECTSCTGGTLGSVHYVYVAVGCQ